MNAGSSIRLSDACLPPDLGPAPRLAESAGLRLESFQLAPEHIAPIAERLTQNAEALASVPASRLLEAWSETIDHLLDPKSPERQTLQNPLESACGLSPQGLDAALEVMLRGVESATARRIFDQARDVPPLPSGFAFVILASNLPALAVQTLLPALALRRPVWFKSASAEPFFTPLLIRQLARREPILRQVFAASAWSGGHRDLEDPLIARAARVVAYGGGEAMRDLRRRAAEKLVAQGPKLSLAILSADVDPVTVAPRLARDIALFDQRGCLSIQAIYTDGDAHALADAMAAALKNIAQTLPAGQADASLVAQVQQLRALADMQALYRPPMDLRHGTVIVDERSDLEPSPGWRTVRIYPVRSLEEIPERLRPWTGRLQGAALAGASAWPLEATLASLGFSRFSPPGELQSADATWHNGGLSPFEALGA